MLGKNNYGQLGYKKNTGKTNEFAPVEYFQENEILIKDFSCGGNNTGAIDYEGNLYMFGEYKIRGNRLGIDDSYDKYPQLITNFNRN